MALTLGDMDNFLLSDLDNLTLNELDQMTFDELKEAVRQKTERVASCANMDMVLSEDQKKMIAGIVREYDKQHKRQSRIEEIKLGLAVNAIWEMLSPLTDLAAQKFLEATEMLKEADIFLTDILRQMLN